MTNIAKKKKKFDDAEDKMITKFMQRMDERMTKDKISNESEPEYNFELSLKSIHPDYKMDAKMGFEKIQAYFQVSYKLSRSRIFNKSRATPK
ncbi:unnamed protein product [Pieris brassicae]|uniref:Uncharacterized protein n=1 Tax=Pieris brassicae TaxID=7116 RepID=A0A9P0TRA5_PIEBR|nr:unnamed protein product [Pieris brassicae]